LKTTKLDYTQYWKQALDYSAYRSLMEQQSAEGRTSGPNQSEAMIQFTALNDRRMQRLDRKTKLLPEIAERLEQLTQPQRWLVITETWCGDAAQVLPVLDKMSQQHPGIEMKLIWRDEFPELIDAHLTNGSKAIPKLIGLNKQFDLLGDWGARPEAAQAIVMKNKAAMQGLEGEERAARYNEAQIELQQWYNKDKGVTIQEVVMAAVAKWSNV